MASTPPSIFAPWTTRNVSPSDVTKGAICILLTQHVPEHAKFASEHGACTPNPHWMGMFAFCMEVGPPVPLPLHARAHRPQALRRIQDPETRPFVLFVEQVVTEEMFRRGLATGISEVTPARPPLAWRFWVMFRTIDAYAQYAATFEAMMEEGAAAAQKRRGSRKGGAVYVDPASFHSIAGQKDFITGLQYHQGVGSATHVVLDAGANPGPAHLLTIFGPDRLFVEGACPGQQRPYVSGGTAGGTSGAMVDGFDDGQDFAPVVTFRAPYFDLRNTVGRPARNPFLSRYNRLPWPTTDDFVRLAYIGTPTPPGLLERHLVRRATSQRQIDDIRASAADNDLDAWLLANPEIDDPRDAGIVCGYQGASGGGLSRAALMAPEFAQNEETDVLRALRDNVTALADQVTSEAAVADFVEAVQGPAEFIDSVDLPTSVPANYSALARLGVSTRKIAHETPHGRWAAALFDRCETVSDLLRSISKTLERHVGLHVAQVTVALWLLLAVMVPLLGPAPRAHTVMVGQPQAGKSWLVDVLRKVTPFAFRSTDYSSEKAVLLDMYGPRVRLLLPMRLAPSDLCPGHLLRGRNYTVAGPRARQARHD